MSKSSVWCKSTPRSRDLFYNIQNENSNKKTLCQNLIWSDFFSSLVQCHFKISGELDSMNYRNNYYPLSACYVLALF